MRVRVSDEDRIKWYDSDSYQMLLAKSRATDLYHYMFERWRNEPALYHAFCKPVISRKCGVTFELA